MIFMGILDHSIGREMGHMGKVVPDRQLVEVEKTTMGNGSTGSGTSNAIAPLRCSLDIG